MNPAIWAKIHGASVHLPLAMGMCSWALDAAGLVLARRAIAPQLHAAGFWTIMLAGLGTFPAVGSGLMMTKGEMLGHGLVLWHHLFVWPAFALLVGLAGWRVVAGVTPGRRAFGFYLAVGIAAAVLLAGAGYFGGEVLLGN